MEEEDEDDGGGPGPMRLRAAGLIPNANPNPDDEGEDCDFVIVLMVYAKPLDMEFLVPPQWRPATTIVEITKNRMELMAEICEVVTNANNTEVLDRIAGTDSSDSSGLQPAVNPRKRTAVRGAAASDARTLLPRPPTR